jgi:hypothetical protein
MPSPYTGNAGNTQAPSGPPAAGSPPIVNLPIDTDPPNAATWAQAYKVLADFCAWLLAPFANLGAWAQAIVRFRNAVNQTRFAIDHAGFPSGKMVQWGESWDNLSDPFKSTVGLGPWFDRWNYSISGDSHGGSIAINQALVGPPTFGGGPTGTNSAARTTNVYLATNPNGTTDSALLVEATGQIIIDDDTCLTMQWDAETIGGTPTANTEDTMGFTTTSLLGATGTTLSNAPFGAWFEVVYNTGGPTYVHCRWKGNSGPIGLFNTFVNAGTRQRFRIEYYGANVSDTGAARLIFYLNGTKITDQAVDFTNATPLGASAVAAPFFRHDETASLSWLNVQVTDLRANTWPGDVAV